MPLFQIERLRSVLSGAAALQQERHWQRASEGDLDDARLVDALAGEANVFRRRQARAPRPGEPPTRPKRALFLFDASASMYRFNGSDGRLRRSCETLVMIMEALQGLEKRFEYAVYCHDGDTPLQAAFERAFLYTTWNPLDTYIHLKDESYDIV